MQTIANVQVRDQTLQVNAPKLASGGVNKIKMVFSFCPLWDGFSNTAVFYRDKSTVYHVLIDDDNSCIVPHEVTDDPGAFYFGVFGTKDDVVRTTEVLALNLLQGPPLEGTTPEEPTPDIYQQLLTELDNVGEQAKAAEAAANAAKTAAATAQNTANTAKSAATTAQSTAEDAGEDAREALSALNGCWLEFADEDGNPTDEPYLHWEEGTEPGETPQSIYSELLNKVEKAVSVEPQALTDAQKTQALENIGALPLTGGKLATGKAEVLVFEDTAGESVYTTYMAGGGYRSTQGYYKNMAYIANEKAGGARIGVNDQKEPEYRTGSGADTAKTLLHTGNAEEKLNLLYTDAPIPFAEQQCGSPVNINMWVTEYAYKKGYVQHIKTRVMEGWTGVSIAVGIIKAHDMTLLRKYTTTADAGEVIIPVEEYIGCDFYVALAGEGLDYKSFEYGTYPMRFFTDNANTYLRNLNEGDIVSKTFADQVIGGFTDNTTSYVVAQEVTYNGRYNTSAPHTYTRNKMFAAGDSITAGHPTYTEGIHWWETVGRTLGYEVTKGAQNGNGFAYLSSPTSNNACVIANKTDFKLYDVAVFAFGTNDYGNNIAMGTIDDAPNHVTDNTGTFYAAVKYVVEKVLTSNPTCMLIFALPINRCDKSSTFETNWCFGKANTAGHTLSDYCDAIINVCNKYGIPYIDRRNGIVNAYTVQTLMCDKLHPTDEGYKLLGMEMAARIGALIRPYAEYNG